MAIIGSEERYHSRDGCKRCREAQSVGEYHDENVEGECRARGEIRGVRRHSDFPSD